MQSSSRTGALNAGLVEAGSTAITNYVPRAAGEAACLSSMRDGFDTRAVHHFRGTVVQLAGDGELRPRTVWVRIPPVLPIQSVFWLADRAE